MKKKEEMKGRGGKGEASPRPSGREGVGVVGLGSVCRAWLRAGVLPRRHPLVLHVQVWRSRGSVTLA